jgi:hypothetical protein
MLPPPVIHLSHLWVTRWRPAVPLSRLRGRGIHLSSWISEGDPARHGIQSGLMLFSLLDVVRAVDAASVAHCWVHLLNSCWFQARHVVCGRGCILVSIRF